MRRYTHAKFAQHASLHKFKLYVGNLMSESAYDCPIYHGLNAGCRFHQCMIPATLDRVGECAEGMYIGISLLGSHPRGSSIMVTAVMPNTPPHKGLSSK